MHKQIAIFGLILAAILALPGPSAKAAAQTVRDANGFLLALNDVSAQTILIDGDIDLSAAAWSTGPQSEKRIAGTPGAAKTLMLPSAVHLGGDTVFEQLNLIGPENCTIYANGHAVTFGAELGGSRLTVFGGAKTDAVQSTRVEIQSGNFLRVYGGGESGSVHGAAYVRVSGGSINTVFGGGLYGACGETELLMDGGAVDNAIYGGGANSPAQVRGSVCLIIQDGAAGKVFGGGMGAGADVLGDVRLAVSGGSIAGDVYGGGQSADVRGDTYLIISGGTFAKNVVAGAYKASVSNASVTLTGGAQVYGSVMGQCAESRAEVTGTKTLRCLGYDDTSLPVCEGFDVVDADQAAQRTDAPPAVSGARMSTGGIAALIALGIALVIALGVYILFRIR